MYYYTVSHHCDTTKRQPVFAIRISFMNCSIVTQRNLWVTMMLFSGQGSFLTMCFGSWVGNVPWRREQLPAPVILAWRIPWTVQLMGSQSVGHDWVTFTFTSVSEIRFCVQHSCCLIHFCLHWVFDAVSLLSPVLASGRRPPAASHHRGFSCGAWALERVGSGRSWCAGIVALQRVGSPWGRVKPVSSALAGRLPTAALPGKPYNILNLVPTGQSDGNADVSFILILSQLHWSFAVLASANPQPCFPQFVHQTLVELHLHQTLF